MKKLFSTMLTISIILYFVACGSSKIPTDEEVIFAYQQAEEAYSWFDLTTMPVVNNSEIECNGNTYLKVNHSSIKSFSDLETYLHSIFSDDIVDSLLENNRYVDIDGAWYASPADRGTSIFAELVFTKKGNLLGIELWRKLKNTYFLHCTILTT